MSTLDTKKTIIGYGTISVFLFIFNRIYENFSYGEYSLFMRNMYLIPIIGIGIILITSGFLKNRIDRVFGLLLNSSMAIFISGCVVKGIIEISGRSSDYDIYYITAGIIFLTLAAARYLYFKISR